MESTVIQTSKTIPRPAKIKIDDDTLIESFFDTVLELKNSKCESPNFEIILSKNNNDVTEQKNLLNYFAKKSPEQIAAYPFFENASEEYIKLVAEAICTVLHDTAPSLDNAELKLGVFKKLFASRNNAAIAEIIEYKNQLGIFKHLHLTGVTMNGLNLSKLDLSNIDLSGSNLFGAKLTEANLNNTKLDNANLICAELLGANLHGTSLRKANVEEASFDNGVDLTGTIGKTKTSKVLESVNSKKQKKRGSRF